MFTTPLSVAVLRAAAECAGLADIDVESVQRTGSTNTDLLVRARIAQPARPVLRVALAQTAGRGRFGRRWVAAPGSALLFSLAVALPRAREADAAVTLACGTALAEALIAEGVPAQLKWPNDLQLESRKLGGVLCELGVDAQGARTLVAGVGVNLWLDATAHESIGAAAAALNERLAFSVLARDRAGLVARLAAALVEAVALFDVRGFLPFQPRFMRRFAQLGQPVELIAHGVRVATGRALGIDGSGRLLLDTDAGVRTFDSGEISLRAADARPSHAGMSALARES